MSNPYTVEQHVTLSRVSNIAASPDGSWLAAVVQRQDLERAKYVSDLWKLPTDGGAAVQLTRGDSNDTAPCFRHDGALGFLSNRKPNEVKADDEADKRMQVWFLPASGGEPQQLSDEPLGVQSFKFARKANALLLFAPVLPNVAHDKQRETAAERAKKGPSARHFKTQPVRHWDHWLHQNPDMANTHLVLYTASCKERVDLTPEATREFAIEPHLDIADDASAVLASWSTPGADREKDDSIVVIDIASKTRKLLGVATNASNFQALFSPDGKTIATVRSTRSPKDVVRPTLTLIDVASGALRTLATEWDRWPDLAAWSDDGLQLLITADDDGHTPVYAVNAANGTVTRLVAHSAGGAHSNVVALANGEIACIRSTLLSPPECAVIASQPNSVPRALAQLSGYPGADFAELEFHRTPSTDGVPIQWFFMKPKGASGKLPTLLWIHGGPIGMDQDGWHWRWNPLLAVAAGYAVALPNPRGSTGFGQAFIQGIWGNCWGKQCYEDLMAVTDAVEQRADVDASRIMAMGGSFGGYMTNWIGTQTQRFKCLITHASVFTMAQFTGTTDHPAWWYLEMGGEDPYADMHQFDRYAPVRYIKNWKTPTLIIHGEQDYRCPIGEGLYLFEALQYHGVDSEMVVFPDEGHWIQKPRNVVAWYGHVLGFLARHMR